jgi:hypothetical protein
MAAEIMSALDLVDGDDGVRPIITGEGRFLRRADLSAAPQHSTTRPGPTRPSAPTTRPPTIRARFYGGIDDARHDPDAIRDTGGIVVLRLFRCQAGDRRHQR